MSTLEQQIEEATAAWVDAAATGLPGEEIRARREKVEKLRVQIAGAAFEKKPVAVNLGSAAPVLEVPVTRKEVKAAEASGRRDSQDLQDSRDSEAAMELPGQVRSQMEIENEKLKGTEAKLNRYAVSAQDLAHRLCVKESECNALQKELGELKAEHEKLKEFLQAGIDNRNELAAQFHKLKEEHEALLRGVEASGRPALRNEWPADDLTTACEALGCAATNFRAALARVNALSRGGKEAANV